MKKEFHLRLFIVFTIVFAGTGCVMNKQYQYLQNQDVNAKPGVLLKDSILRSYDLDDFEYKLQPEDVLSISFFSLTPGDLDFFSIKGGSTVANFNRFQNGAATLVNGYLVDENGDVEFPVVGKVRVSGLTVFEAQNKLLKMAENYLTNPTVEVRLLNFRFTLLGEVKQERTIVSLNNRITTLEAIGLAGGFTDFADKSNIKVIRHSEGKAEVFYINLLDESFVGSPYYYMNQNDIIVVPPLKQRPFQNYFGKNLSLGISTVSLLLLVFNLAR